ncbi:MAG: hydantoinase/carbamoylase family amidase [Candidatus Eisenbacteria bacterium]|uniref:Hydantoinase/carbamoylase family amidase n=1 Tax=Eiseniibacteriota bacterium TaxID=2212470 RepID=A0A849SWQ7_UNCEI|nr:hydantoinase/carbamoylase family amidase [Candidatus Eisenbacteria bacterium]
MAAFDRTTLMQLLEGLARHSAPGPGITRLVYDDAWIDAHRWLCAEARAVGLEASADAAGNLLFHPRELRPDPSNPPRALMVGSHLDSVRNGGRYDGAYGVIAGLMLAAEHRGGAGLPVIGFVTCEEEQSRLDGHMLGGRSLLGEIENSVLDVVKDADGVSWRQALEAARKVGCAVALAEGARPFPPLVRPAAQLELHIEQGPVLETSGELLGVVERIAGYRRVRARFEGDARHSGTTPMSLRRDALAAAAELVLETESLARDAGAPAVATAGNARVSPGLYNVVPGACELWLEVRHSELSRLDALQAELERRARAIAARRGLSLTLETLTQQAPTELSLSLAASARQLATERAVSHRVMVSGAAHDTMEFARAGIPALLLFVPSHGGISHSPDEFSEPDELWAGLEFASELLTRWRKEVA